MQELNRVEQAAQEISIYKWLILLFGLYSIISNVTVFLAITTCNN